MSRICAFALLLAVSPSFAHAEVVVRYSDEPLVELYRQQLEAATALARKDFPVRKSNEPSDGTWVIPLFKVDSKASGFGSSTFFSVRNEGDVTTNVLVEYFNKTFTPPRLHAQRYVLIPKAIASANARDVLGDLDVDPDGFARGLILVTPRAEEPISVDVFQVDGQNDFASGELAFVVPDDLCTFWQVRFLDFGTTSGDGSVLSVFVNGPRGLSPANPPTLVATLYNQQGAPVRSAEIRTDQWSFEVDLSALAGSARFGSADLILNAASLPGGVAAVSHRALGKFSVGLEGVCRDRI